ncbi:putative cubilin-like isoform X1 [Penaeus vannamei]|uniref:Putative cubilin-like isoform X1 n=1 Tax=Penaeus vannamei TaxID=6689 RepID=A0A3R7PW76_PENVA|nr:putative cubilin-like isoform X1 [Penaeus vannamei]
MSSFECEHVSSTPRSWKASTTQTSANLVRNLSRVAQTVASQQWISSSIEGLKSNASRSRGNIATLRNDVTSIQSTLRDRLDPLVANVSQLSTQVGLITPEGGQRLQQINTVIQNLQQASTEAASARQDLVDRVIPGLRQDVTQLQTGIVGLPQLRDRIEALEAQVNGSDISDSSGPLSASDSSTIRRIKRNLRRLNARLQVNECASGPCLNGATCIDGYMSYTCLCPKGWTGENCDDDFNECYEFFGTDLGCQNGATCVNTPGSYTCQCAAGWYGVHCTLKTDSCTASTGSSLCGPNGVCINTPRKGHSYSCVCDEGWTPGNSTPACVDVNECTSYHTRCSSLVTCVNYPGGFQCGPCPTGGEATSVFIYVACIKALSYWSHTMFRRLWTDCVVCGVRCLSDLFDYNGVIRVLYSYAPSVTQTPTLRWSLSHRSLHR